MKTVKLLTIFSLLMFIFVMPVFAANENDPERADEWFMKERLKMPAPKSKKSTEDYIKEGQEKLKARENNDNITRNGEYGSIQAKYDKNYIPRYIMLFSDDSFTYWLDTEALQWRPMPYSAFEDMLDCWVKMENISEEAEYTYPATYYMEHLYLRPARRQVMFMSELEVTGRPKNDIKEHQYKAEYWEELVPGSVEEEIYKGTLRVLKTLEKKHKINKRQNSDSGYNFFEDVIGIAGIF